MRAAFVIPILFVACWSASYGPPPSASAAGPAPIARSPIATVSPTDTARGLAEAQGAPTPPMTVPREEKVPPPRPAPPPRGQELVESDPDMSPPVFTLSPRSSQDGVAGTSDSTPAGRYASLADTNLQASCKFPPEADAAAINEASVTVRVRVDEQGKAQHVEVISDPGYGFARSARACAMAARYEPAKDERGRAVASETKPLRIHYAR